MSIGVNNAVETAQQAIHFTKQLGIDPTNDRALLWFEGPDQVKDAPLEAMGIEIDSVLGNTKYQSRRLPNGGMLVVVTVSDLQKTGIAQVLVERLYERLTHCFCS